MIKYYNNNDWKYLEQFKLTRERVFGVRLRCLICNKFIKRHTMDWNDSPNCPHCKNDLRTEKLRHIVI